MTLHQAVASVNGIGEKKARLLEKLGIHTVADLLYHMPRGYEPDGPSIAMFIISLCAPNR